MESPLANTEVIRGVTTHLQENISVDKFCKEKRLGKSRFARSS
jgi:hypothetical protein